MFPRIYTICFLLLIQPAAFSPASEKIVPNDFQKTTKSVLKPVYTPLAAEIAQKFNLAEKKGIAIDLGSGPGDLIIELCKKTGYLHWINADINPGFFPDFINRLQLQEIFDKNRKNAMAGLDTTQMRQQKK